VRPRRQLGGADAIVTLNLSDFPPAAPALFGVTAVSPDDFLAEFLEVAPTHVVSILRAQAADLTRPPVPSTSWSSSARPPSRGSRTRSAACADPGGSRYMCALFAVCTCMPMLVVVVRRLGGDDRLAGARVHERPLGCRSRTHGRPPLLVCAETTAHTSILHTRRQAAGMPRRSSGFRLERRVPRKFPPPTWWGRCRQSTTPSPSSRRRRFRGSAPQRKEPAFTKTVLPEMELGGLEPPTSWVRSRRSPN